MTPSLSPGFSCYAKGNSIYLTRAFWDLTTFAAASRRDSCSLLIHHRCYIPAAPGLWFIRWKETHTTCSACLQGASSSQSFPSFYSSPWKPNDTRYGPNPGGVSSQKGAGLLGNHARSHCPSYPPPQQTTERLWGASAALTFPSSKSPMIRFFLKRTWSFYFFIFFPLEHLKIHSNKIIL